jgi:hypothetical protein
MKWYEGFIPFHSLIAPDIRDAPPASSLSCQEIERRAKMCSSQYSWDLLVDRLYPPPRKRDYLTARQCREDQAAHRDCSLSSIHYYQ